jgi:F420-non-reducing hydrogenase iron-sulfur subunit
MSKTPLGETTGARIAIFYCSRHEKEIHQILEGCNGSGVKEFRRVPLPCSGKLEVFQLTRAFEGGADGVALFGCPEGACRYLVGSSRARGRVAHAERILEEIGLGRDRLRRFILGDQTTGESLKEMGQWVEKIRSLGPIDKLKREEPKAK